MGSQHIQWHTNETHICQNRLFLRQEKHVPYPTHQHINNNSNTLTKSNRMQMFLETIPAIKAT